MMTLPSPRPPRRATRTARAAARQSGFTLLEIVAAFAILAIGLGMAMQAASGAMQQSRQSAEHTRAALHALSVMDTLGVGERLEPGQFEGEFEDGYRWRVEVSPYELDAEELPAGFDPGFAAVALLRVDLVIGWQRGGQEAEARFTTLRAMLPNR